MKKRIVAGLFFCVLLPASAQNTSLQEVFTKWTVIGQGGNGSVLSIKPSTSDFERASFFRNANGEYEWWMKAEYRKPKNNVSAIVNYGYFNCDTGRVSVDQTIRYAKNGAVLDITGERGGKRTEIPAPPNSLTEAALNFICKHARFDQ